MNRQPRADRDARLYVPVCSLSSGAAGKADSRTVRFPPASVIGDTQVVRSSTLGQHLGDEVLRVTARRVQQVLQGQGVAASLHGDQFGLAAPVRAPVQAADLAQTLRRELVDDHRHDDGY